MKKFECELCKNTQVPSHYGSERTCAFNEDGSFNPENWNCVTMMKLRKKIYDIVDNTSSAMVTLQRNEDQYLAVCNAYDKRDENYVPLDFLCIGWYKNRGRTESMFVLNDSVPVPITYDLFQNIVIDGHE